MATSTGKGMLVNRIDGPQIERREHIGSSRGSFPSQISDILSDWNTVFVVAAAADNATHYIEPDTIDRRNY
jgi:hypothetical protein